MDSIKSISELHLDLFELETEKHEHEKQIDESTMRIKEIKDEIIGVQYKLLLGYQDELHTLKEEQAEEEKENNNNYEHTYTEGYGGTGGSKQEQKEEHKINDKDIFPKGVIHSGEEPHI